MPIFAKFSRKIALEKLSFWFLNATNKQERINFNAANRRRPDHPAPPIDHHGKMTATATSIVVQTATCEKLHIATRLENMQMVELLLMKTVWRYSVILISDTTYLM